MVAPTDMPAPLLCGGFLTASDMQGQIIKNFLKKLLFALDTSSEC